MLIRNMRYVGLAVLFLGLLTASVGAVALSERVVQQKKADGAYEAYMERMRDLRAQGWNQPGKKPVDHDLALGVEEAVTHKVLVILVDFPNKPYTAGFDNPTAADFDSVLFSEGLNPTGSMKEFYLENSYGNYTVDGDVVGWYRAPLDHDEYNYNPLPPSELVRWAVITADNDVDFSEYDNNGDGYVEGVIVVHAGTGHEESGDPTEIHSHMSQMSAVPVDGVFVNRYTIQPEESFSYQEMSSIGVFCHEWGHILYLPDLYDTDGSCEAMGRWSLMGSGSYNGGSRLPAHFDAWCKKELGWLSLTNITSNTIAAEIPAIEHNPVAYRLNKNGQGGSEYWILENRYNTGFDAALPGYGLMIYHIDDSEPYNTNDWHPLLFVEQADGKFDLQGHSNRGDAGDPWPTGNAYHFHDKTIPGSRYYVGSSSQVGVWNISERDSVMTADLEVNFSRPWVELSGILLRDNAYGNGNGIPEAGEKIQLVLTLLNDWAEATDISVTMTTDDPNLVVTEGVSDFPSIAMGGTSSNIDSPFEFQIPAVFESRIDSFYFDVTANGETYQVYVGSEANIGKPQLLIVDDDGGEQLDQYMSWPLYAERTPSDIWRKNLSGSPTISDLSNYFVVIWMTGNIRDYLLSQDDVEALKGYLDGGGNLFLTGQGLAEQLKVQDPYFLNNYLMADYVDSTYNFIPVLSAADGPISAGMRSIVIFGSSGASNQTVYNHVVPYGSGEAEWAYPGTNDYGAVSFSGSYKSVFFAFGFEAIESDDSRFETQETVLARILEFFGDLPTDVEDQNGMAVNLPTHFVLDQNYPNPFNPTTTISYVITGSGPRFDRTRLDIMNILGQRITSLVDRIEVPGQYSVVWDGRDESGREVASGLYFYRLIRGSQDETKKMLLLK